MLKNNDNKILCDATIARCKYIVNILQKFVVYSHQLVQFKNDLSILYLKCRSCDFDLSMNQLFWYFPNVIFQCGTLWKCSTGQKIQLGVPIQNSIENCVSMILQCLMFLHQICNFVSLINNLFTPLIFHVILQMMTLKPNGDLHYLYRNVNYVVIIV